MNCFKIARYMDIAFAVSGLSKDSTKVGAVVLDSRNRPVSFGYNGYLKGIEDSCMPTSRPDKYGVTCHAEMNAIIFAQRSLDGCKMFVTYSPCDECLKYIIQAGIKEIYYREEYAFKNLEAIHLLLEASGVSYIQVKEDSK